MAKVAPWRRYLDGIPPAALVAASRPERAAPVEPGPSPFKKPTTSGDKPAVTGIVPQKKSANQLDENSRWGPGWSADPKRKGDFKHFNNEDMPF